MRGDGGATFRFRNVTTSPNFWSAERMSLLSERERGAGWVLMWMLLVKGLRVILSLLCGS